MWTLIGILIADIAGVVLSASERDRPAKPTKPPSKRQTWIAVGILTSIPIVLILLAALAGPAHVPQCYNYEGQLVRCHP
jgi:hypothetical protein